MNRNPEGRRALGAVLRRFREARDLSQQALGLEADVDRTYVGAVERGEQNPSFENVWQLLAAMRVSWTELGRALDAEPALRAPPNTRSSTPRPRVRSRPPTGKVAGPSAPSPARRPDPARPPQARRSDRRRLDGS